MSSLRRLILGFTCLSLLASSAALKAELPATVRSTPVLHLSNGDYVAGTLINSKTKTDIGWQSPAFTGPFYFALTGIASIHFPVPARPVQPSGDYCFELSGGDMLFGALNGIDAKTVSVDSPGIGRLTVDRAFVQRMYRRGGGTDQIFVGPNGLSGWSLTGGDDAWSEEAGQLFSETPLASLRRNFDFPQQARFEFELSWTGQPDFELALGVGDDPKTAMRAYSFQVWENEIVVQRETEKDADVVSLQKVTEKSGHIHLQAFLDQTKERLLVLSSSGKQLADLTVRSAKPQVFGGLQLTNRSGNVRLQRLQIGRWNGEKPRIAEVNKSRIHGTDGTIAYGTLSSYDAEKHEFVIGEGDNSKKIPESQVHDVFLSQSAAVVPRSLRAVFLTGMKLSGDLNQVEENKVTLKCPGIQEPIVTSIDSLQSFVVLVPKASPAASPKPGRLETTETRLHGNLVEGRSGETHCLVWQPTQSSTSSPLQSGISGRIVYKDPPPPAAQNPQAAVPQNQAIQVRVRQGGIIGRIQEMFVDGPSNNAGKNPTKAQSVLHLRTGDKLPCTVTGIDERGVSFESKQSDAKFVSHDQIQALELLSDAPPVQIPTVKKQRLLTLPRMQRDNPPTHLVRSVDGDYLRGRIISMDETQMQIEVRLETKIVRRDRIARILWLHPESASPGTANDVKRASAQASRVQALLTEGNRITFVPDQFSGTTLSGKSEFLGACRVDVQNLDQLIMGAAIELEAAGLPFHDWKLKQAIDPVEPKDPGDDPGDSSEGTESVLVGKPAPDIKLNFLDGKIFRLADHKDKVVILDFWASWCGPCLQVMPQIDKVTSEFADQGVELFAVNLEESEDKVRAALERLRLETNVIMDRDGRTAERYGATAIPQTVIIDRDGNVARLFVGGGARFDDRLRSALKSVLAGDAKSNP